MWVFISLVVMCLLVVAAGIILLTSADATEGATNKGLIGFAWFVIALFVLTSVGVAFYFIIWKRWQNAL